MGREREGERLLDKEHSIQGLVAYTVTGMVNASTSVDNRDKTDAIPRTLSDLLLVVKKHWLYYKLYRPSGLGIWIVK